MNGADEMSTLRDERIDGEYDRALPERIAKPTEEDHAHLKKLLEKYDKKEPTLAHRRDLP